MSIDLEPAEQQAAWCIARGDIARPVSPMGPVTEQSNTPDLAHNALRADFVRLLMRGEIAQPAFAGKISIEGYYILGAVDLRSSKITLPIEIIDCTIVTSGSASVHQLADLMLDHACTRSIVLRGTSLSALTGWLVHVDGYLGLDAEYADEHGNIKRRFRADQGVDLRGANITKDLLCNGGYFGVNHATKSAIILDRAKVGGSVFLSRGFEALGRVRLVGATVANDLVCAGGTFRPSAQDLNQRRMRRNKVPFAPTALDLPDVRVGGVLYLGPCPHEGGQSSPMTDKHVNIFGTLDLQGAKVAELSDARLSWPREEDQTLGHALKVIALRSLQQDPSPRIILDGFTYDRLAPGCDTKYSYRKRWIKMAPHDFSRFAPQPIEHLAKHFRETGHERVAGQLFEWKAARRLWFRLRYHALYGLAEDYQGARTVKGVAAKLSYLNDFAVRLLLWVIRVPFLLLSILFFYFFSGGGYARKRLLVWFVAVWFVGGATYQFFDLYNVFAPTNPVIYRDAELRRNCASHWTSCASIPEHSTFSPWLFSADQMLPIISLGQKQSWDVMDQPISLRVQRPPHWLMYAASTIHFIQRLFDGVAVHLGKWLGVRGPDGQPAPLWSRGDDLLAISQATDPNTKTTHSVIQLASNVPRLVLTVHVILGWALGGLIIALLSGVMRQD